MAETDNFTNTRRKPRPALIVLIVLIHLLALYGLARALAPSTVASVEESVVSAFTVTITAPEEPEPEPDAGAAGEQGRKATPKPVTAPEPPIPVPRPTRVPKASSTGAADTSGARDSGDGTGASGDGLGTGSGRGGAGTGGGIAEKPSVRSDSLNEARDFHIPEGGRNARVGTSVTVVFTVTTDGRAKNCSVANSTADAESTALVCPKVIEKVRFNPARRADGTPVEARYGYRLRFKAR